MTYFMVSGDEDCDAPKLKKLVEDHQLLTPVTARKQVRLEAENFRYFEGCILEDRKDKKASHELNTKVAPGTTGRIRTPFDEPFTSPRARYDVDVRYLDEKGSPGRLALFINGIAQGPPWESKGEGRGWTTKTIRDIEISLGDEIRVDIDGAPGRLDYVQLNLR